MNKLDEKKDNFLNNKKHESISLGDNSKIEFINLKMAQRSVKIYKLINLEKEKLNDYYYIMEKIKSNSKNKNNTYQIIIYIKLISGEEIRINSESEWKNYFENSKWLNEILDSKNTLKLEYSYCGANENDNQAEHELQEAKIRNMLVASDSIEIDILKLVFTYALKNDTIKSRIKEEINSNQKNDKDGIINSRCFDLFIKNFFDKTIGKIHNVSLIKKSIQNEEEEKDQDEEHILFDQEDAKLENVNGPLEVAPFSEFYNNDQKELFKSKLLSQTFSVLKSTK